MSKYTTEVRFICEFEAGLEKSAGFNDVESIIRTAAPKIFGTDWPIFDENYRLALETKILRHYYTREIGEETVGLWKLRLVDTLNMIMPYYNQLYKSETLEFNPLYDVDYTTTNNGTSDTTSNRKVDYNSNEADTGTVKDDNTNTRKVTNNGTTASEQHSTSDHNSDDSQWHLYSDTPQGGIIGIANAEGSVERDAYLTNAQHDTDVLKEDTQTDTNGTVTSSDTTNDDYTGNNTKTLDTRHTKDDNTNENATINNINQYIEHVAGKRGGVSYSKMLQDYRDTMLNIDADIINDLSTLFFGLWE